MKITTSGGTSAIASVTQTYEWASVPTGSSNALPLAVAMGGPSQVWVNKEFETTFSALDIEETAATDQPPPAPAIGAARVFELFSHCNIETVPDNDPTKPDPKKTCGTNADCTVQNDYCVGNSSATSEGGEATLVDPRGEAWMTQGGDLYFEHLQVANHSRIVRYLGANTSPLIYNIPGDDNRVDGIAYDSDRDRIWYSTSSKISESRALYPTLFPAKLISFHPLYGNEFNPVGISPTNTDSNYAFPTTGITCSSDRYCSNAPSARCESPADCVRAQELCPIGSSCDTETTNADGGYYHQYPLGSLTGQVAHILVDKRGSSRNIWYSVYGAYHTLLGDCSNSPLQRCFFDSDCGTGNTCVRSPDYNAAMLGRLNPALPTSSSNPEEYPLASFPPLVGVNCQATPGDVRCIGRSIATSGPWVVLKSPDGDIVFDEGFTNRLSRFRASNLSDTSICKSLTNGDNGTNPCIDSVVIPAANPATDFVHSIAYDQSNNLWFTLGTVSSFGSTVGYLRPDWLTFVMLPPLSVFQVNKSSSVGCPGDSIPLGSNVQVSGAGITTDPVLGDIWFADYCRRRLGRIRDFSFPADSIWTVVQDTDDAWEDGTQLATPSTPKTTAITLRLEPVNGQGEIKTIAAMRLTSSGAANGKAVTAHLKIPITSPDSPRNPRFRISVGVPNDAAWAPNVAGDISHRTKLASVEVEKALTTTTTNIVFDNEIARLLDVAQRDPAWVDGGGNIVPIYISRIDSTLFTLHFKAHENSVNQPIRIDGIRGGS